MKEKTYTIDNTKFYLKTDLTLDEADLVNELLKGLYTEQQGQDVEGKVPVIRGNFTSAEIKRFLGIVLESESPALPMADTPLTKGGLGDGFDFGKIKESVQMEVFKDFFVERLSRAMSSANAFAESIKQQ